MRIQKSKKSVNISYILNTVHYFQIISKKDTTNFFAKRNAINTSPRGSYIGLLLPLTAI